MNFMFPPVMRVKCGTVLPADGRDCIACWRQAPRSNDFIRYGAVTNKSLLCGYYPSSPYAASPRQIRFRLRDFCRRLAALHHAARFGGGEGHLAESAIGAFRADRRRE